MPQPSPRSLHTARAAPGVAVAAVLALALWSFAFAVSAAPAPWYYWRSKIDGARVCAQTSPGPGWDRDSAAYDGPGCQPRRKVLVVPMR
ncbi:MAG: hypothetical protein Q8N13_09465 [Acidovorax sp.]|nr:hypothetical protein [Acidovorax sp.]